MKTQSKITNETLRKQTETRMAGEIGCLNLLSERANSEFTVENLFRFQTNPRWEIEAELTKAQKECKGHLKHLLPKVEEEIRESYTEEYFYQIGKCFAELPRGLRPEEVVMKGDVLSYTEPYRQARLAVATLELSEHETEVFNALSDAREAVATLKSVLGSGLWNGELEYLILTDKPTAEVGFEYFDQQKIRKSLNY